MLINSLEVGHQNKLVNESNTLLHERRSLPQHA